MFAAKAFTIASLFLAGAKAFDVSTPANVVQCGDTQVTVSGATGKYYLAVVPAAEPCESDALFEADALTDGSYTWKVQTPTDTEVVLYAEDDSGAQAWSGPFKVGDGDGSCSISSGNSNPGDSTPSPASPTSASATQTNLVINEYSGPSSANPSISAPANAQGNGDGNTPSTGAAFSKAQASLFTIFTVMGTVAMTL